MQEESKEEFLERLRKERGIDPSTDLTAIEEKPRNQAGRFKARLKSLFFLLLLALFFYAILQIFGMLKSN